MNRYYQAHPIKGEPMLTRSEKLLTISAMFAGFAFGILTAEWMVVVR